ncbi:MAG TPA: efflux RND transporter periplasmic adaptor subunit, partial [Opitutales bacterium]|nr:efflux RND transporter periplasmic adaptor subunit [Opitutales bacterium]
LAFENAKEKLRLLTKYEYPKQVRKLQSDVEQAEAALERTKSRFAAELAQAEGSLKAREATLELEKSRLDRISNELENTRIYAPQEGLVIYATYRDWRSGGNERPLEVGASIGQRQELITLPDLSKMLVQVKIHESQRYQLREGLPALVTIDSIPDRRFRGTVTRISVLPDAESRWLNPDLKVYTTDILIEDDIPDVNPGVSARAEILVDELDNVLQVPIQSVSTIDGERVVYRMKRDGPEAIPVQIGSFNDSFIEIQSGLVEGDWVFLSSPHRQPEQRNGKMEAESENQNTNETDESDPANPSLTATIEPGAN